MWGGHDLGDKIRVGFGHGEHFARLFRVHGHAGLYEDVFAGFEGGYGHGGVHVRPCADAYGLDIIIINDFKPRVVDLGDLELLGDPFA